MTLKNLGVHLKVQNFKASTRFYQSLGFKKVFEYGPDCSFRKGKDGHLLSAPEAYRGMTFALGDARLEIADGHRAVKPQVFQEKITGSKISLMINIDDLPGFLEICRQAKIALAVGPRHYYWGTLEVVLKDPDGTVLVFIAPYREKVAREIDVDETWAKLPK